MPQHPHLLIRQHVATGKKITTKPQNKYCRFVFPGRYEHANGIFSTPIRHSSAKIHPTTPSTTKCWATSPHGRNPSPSNAASTHAGATDSSNNARRDPAKYCCDGCSCVTRKTQFAWSDTGGENTLRSPTTASPIIVSVGIMYACVTGSRHSPATSAFNVETAIAKMIAHQNA